MILLHPCATCPKGLVEARNTSCVRCVAAFEAEFNPIDPIQRRPARQVPPLLKFLRWLGGQV